MPPNPAAWVHRIGLDLGLATDVGLPDRAAAAAAAGARLARVRVALDGRTAPDAVFLATLSTAMDALRRAGLGVLAVVDSDLTVAPGGMGALGAGATTPLGEAWTAELVANAEAVARAVGAQVTAWEILPGPNAGADAASGERYRIAPGRWAALLATIGAAIRRAVPGEAGAVIVSGGLVSDDTDDGIDYLRSAYVAWDRAGVWTPDQAPFDRLGIQLAVLADGGAAEEVVAYTLTDRVRRLWRVRESFEGTGVASAGGLMVTAVGWDAGHTGDDIQARNLWTALNALTSEELVHGVLWSALADGAAAEGTPAAMGLFRGQSLAVDDRRPAWQAFRDFATYLSQIAPAASASAGQVDLWSPTVPAEEPSADAGPPAEGVSTDEASHEASPTQVESTAQDSPFAIEEGSHRSRPGLLSQIDALINRLVSGQEQEDVVAEPTAAASAPPAASPEPEDPAESIVPTAPLEPGEPAQSIEPTAPAEPVEPAESIEPTALPEPWEPAQSIEPTALPEPAETAQAIEPTALPEPGEIAQSIEPTAPAEPVEPAESLQPMASPQPEEPAESLQPTASPEPGEPAEVIAPMASPEPGESAEVVHFHVPTVAEVLKTAGLDGVRLAAALEAAAVQLGSADSLAPGDYSLVVSPPRAAPAEVAQEPAPPAYTNQEVINAIYRAGGNTWALFERTGLVFSELALRRNDAYAGPALASLTGLTDDARAAVAAELAALRAS